MEYTTKDVCKMFNITRETLRHYERKGIIQPKISKENNYRYYDDWDINYIGECKKYQSIGFSISEVKDILSDGSLKQFIHLVEQKQEDFKRKAQIYKLLVEKNSKYLNVLKNITEQLDNFEIIESNDYYHLPCRENFEYDLSYKVLEPYHIALENYAFFENTVMINKEDFIFHKDIFQWGVSIQKELAEILEFQTDNLIFTKKQISVHAVINAGERWNFGCHLFDKMYRFAQEHHYEIDGFLYGFLMTRVYDKQKYCRYLDVYLPVRKIEE
jgi:DNA-binding transcriptional MerR regulator